MAYKNIEDRIASSKKYYLNNREKIKEKSRLYLLNNKDKIREVKRLYRLNNKDKRIKMNKLYYLKNIEKFKETNKLYNLKNKDNIKKYQSKYYLNNKTNIKNKIKNYNINNPHIRKANKAKRRASELKATPKFANLNKIKEIYKNCPKGYHVDHIIPLQSKIVCGLHVEWNLQYLTPSANSSKSNKLIC